jgi:hypothetical protein
MWEKTYRSVGSAAAGTCDQCEFHFGRVECRDFARTVGNNRVVGPVPLFFGLGGVECHGSVRGSVRRLSSSMRGNRKKLFLTLRGTDCCAGKVRRHHQLYRLEERIKRLKEEWSHLKGDGTHLASEASGSPGSTTESQALWSRGRRSTGVFL